MADLIEARPRAALPYLDARQRAFDALRPLDALAAHTVTASDGVPLAAFEAGVPDAPTVLVVNALGVSAAFVAPLAARLAERHRVILWESRGLPDGGGDAADLSLARHAQDAADVLAALGVKIGLPPEALARCLSEAGLCFMFAQTHHGAMRHVAPVRSELPFRTIFNMLGPLSNPAGVTAQVFGVSRPAWAEPLTRVLATLGSRRVWTVHGSDGLDEITTTGPTAVVALEDGALSRFTIDPREVGLPLVTLDDLRGGDPEHNAAALRAVLEGTPSAYRDIAVLNAGAGLVVAKAAGSLAEGVARAQAAIDSGAARATLARLVAVSNA